MNLSVAKVPVQELAKRNLADLGVIEREIFATTFDDGRLEEDPRPYGQWSGDWVCTECGAMGPRSDFPKDAND
jgi:hypothetical protein